MYQLDRIYYPGCGNDTILTGVLPDSTLYYLDRNVKERSDGVFFHGDYLDAPFESDSFDALFLKDVHIKESGYTNHRERLEALLKPVKKDGLIVGARYGCKIWEIDIPYVRESGLVIPTNMQHPKELEIFIKQ